VALPGGCGPALGDEMLGQRAGAGGGEAR
jgi:hypothetical protein